jgi:PAS domain S-box-containing protein|tara:strand:- start:3482 stop:4720 length:1239 start_codon:yes stop_codon:yes gene_type:complete
MKYSPSYQDLINQITELKKQNERLLLNAKLDGEEVKHQKQIPIEIGKVIESQKFSHTLLNNMGDSIFVKDDKSRLVLVNDAFCEMFNLPREEIIGKTLAENVPQNERESFLKIDSKVLADGIENINEETLTLNGTTRIISTRKSLFIDAKGEKFLVGVIRDISERKKAENALKESEERFRELNATKDKLFSIIAHDLRGPFNNIIGVSALLSKNEMYLEDELSGKYINIINSTAKSTLALLDNLLNWAKSQTDELRIRPEKIIFPQIIHEIVSLERPLAMAKDISLEFRPTKEFIIITDGNILKTVLRNLISNAIKFTHSGGKITILTSVDQKNVEITIADNGVGMSKETMKGLFNISSNVTFLGTLNEKGSGLGLVLSKEFVKKLNGNIEVESEKGKGSNFKISLPLNNFN